MVVTKPEEKAYVFQVVCDFTVQKKADGVKGSAYQILISEPEYQPIACSPIFKILAFDRHDAESAALDMATRSLDPGYRIINSGAMTATTIETLAGVHGIAESVIQGR